MDTCKSFQGEIQKTLAEIYSRMAPESQREVDEFYGLSRSEIENAKGGSHFPTHRIPEGQYTQRSQKNPRLFGLYMNWEEAIKSFKIEKIYQTASMEKVTKTNPQIAEVGMKWLKSDRKPSIVLSGNPGSGKTFFAYSLLHGLVMQEKHRWLIFTSSFNLDNELLRSQLSEEEVIQKYQEVPILFLDDIGVERLTERMIRQYYSIINKRLNNLLPTVFTTNISLEKIKNNLGDRIASRLEMALEIKFPNRDLRKNFLINEV